MPTFRLPACPATEARPRHRPRKDPAAARVVKSFRLHPNTIAAIVDEAQEHGESQGEVIDRWAQERLRPSSRAQQIAAAGGAA